MRLWRQQLLASDILYYPENDVYWLIMCILLVIVIFIYVPEKWRKKTPDDPERSLAPLARAYYM